VTAPLADEALDRVFREARTFNHYVNRPVGEEQLRAIYDLLRWGPTSVNQEPLRLLWCVSDEAKARLAVHCSDTNAAKVRAAPVTAILGMDMLFYDKLPRLYPRTDARSWFLKDGKPKDAMVAESAFRNSTLQGAYLIIAARMLGLDTGPMSGFDQAGVNATFFAGTDVRVNFISTLGYGDQKTLHERLPRLSFEEVNTIL
jgi:3-hydroxypropanoate dehydrogenase